MKIVLIAVSTLVLASQLPAQNVGIGTSSPKARLHVADSSVLFSGPSPLPVVAGLPPTLGNGNRMMWYANKAAFRAGGVVATEWDEPNVGQYSTAFGRNNIASGQYATSFGVANAVSGNAGATAMGANNLVAGNYATAIGYSLTAQSFASVVIGRLNTIAGNTTTWVDTDPLFVVGNGFSTGGIGGTTTRRDALVITKNGYTTINETLTVNGQTNLNDTVKANAYVGINIAPNKAIHTSLEVNGALTLTPSSFFANAANKYLVPTTNTGLIKVTYNEDYTIVPFIKLDKPGAQGQLLIIQAGAAYPFKIASNNDLLNGPYVRLSGTHTMNASDTLTLIYTFDGWLELSFSSNN